MSTTNRAFVAILIVAAVVTFSQSVLAARLSTPLATLVLDSHGASQTTPVLAEGVKYWLLAEGEYRRDGAGNHCDADWIEAYPPDPPEVWVESFGSDIKNQDVVINDTCFDWWGHASVGADPFSDFDAFSPHTFSPSHRYWLPYVGEGESIDICIFDQYYADNGGSLTVSLYVPEPATLSVLALGGLALLRRRR